MISHDLSTAREATEILFLEDGHVAERGTHEVLLESDGGYASHYYLRQTEREGVTCEL